MVIRHVSVYINYDDYFFPLKHVYVEDVIGTFVIILAVDIVFRAA